MSTAEYTLDDFNSNGGARSAIKRDTPDKTVVGGEIVSTDIRQRKAFSTSGDGAPLFWDDGRPQMEIVVIVQTDLSEDEDDSGRRGFYIKTWGSQKRALADAVKAAGFQKLGDALAPGNRFYGQRVGSQPTKKGYNENLFAYKIEGVSKLDSFDLGGEDEPAEAPAQQAPQGGYGNPAAETPQDKASKLIEMGVFGDDQIAAATGLTVQQVAALRG